MKPGDTLNRAGKLALIWKHKHRDYKSIIGGERYVLALRQGGTCLVPLDRLTDHEIERMLPLKGAVQS